MMHKCTVIVNAIKLEVMDLVLDSQAMEVWDYLEVLYLRKNNHSRIVRSMTFLKLGFIVRSRAKLCSSTIMI